MLYVYAYTYGVLSIKPKCISTPNEYLSSVEIIGSAGSSGL